MSGSQIAAGTRGIRQTVRNSARTTIRIIAPLAILILGCSAFTVVASTPASAADKNAAIVVDAHTGNIMYSDSGEEPRHPASLTKMMTIYMAFDQIEQGNLSYDTPITISRTAASQPPSKLGLKPNSTIKLRDALKSLVTKSANDIAVAIGEHIGGSESNFAYMMTRKARELGMTKTVFKNASGLPNSQQITTAKDMVTLSFRLQDHFPKHYTIFKTRSFTYKGKRYKNHNTLLGRVAGVDGIKTGYIRASGFNLVTSIRKDGRHVIAAVFGGRTAGTRNARMRRLLKKYVSSASTTRTRKPQRYVIASAPKLKTRPTRALSVPPAPTPRPVAVARIQPKISMTKVRRVDVVSSRAPSGNSDNYKNAPLAAPQYASRGTTTTNKPTGRPASTLQEQLAQMFSQHGQQSQAYEAAHQRQTPPPQLSPQVQTGNYQIQVGAYHTPAEAERQLETVESTAANLVRGYKRVTEPVATGTRTLYRARFAGFQAADHARQTCMELQKREIACLVAR